MEKIVLNIPHSSVNGIFDEFGKWPRNPNFINECVNKWTDWYTDFLFATTKKQVVSVIFPYSRFVCDVERLDNDPLESVGQGIIYRTFGGYSRGVLSTEEREHLLALRQQHIEKLKHLLTPDSLLIDCHSFSGTSDDSDICLSFKNDDSYDEQVMDIVKTQFEKMHYRVSVNHPYSNSISPSTGFAYKSLMIEVNKQIYMTNSNNLKPNSYQWMRWFGCMNRVYNTILQYSR